MTLYETLTKINGGDITYFTPTQKQDIEVYIKDMVEKKIGMPEYKKLEDFVEQNKDDNRMKELITNITFSLLGGVLMSDTDEITDEKRMSYRAYTKLHEYLSKSNYDLEQALLDSY